MESDEDDLRLVAAQQSSSGPRGYGDEDEEEDDVQRITVDTTSQMARDLVPTTSRKDKLRACMLCGLIKSVPQFRRNGCENCEEVLRLQGSMKRIGDCTSAQFDGVVAMMQPDRSWVGKWQRIDKFTKGLYAIRVSGLLPEVVVDDLADRGTYTLLFLSIGITYRPRDGSVQD